MRPSGQAPSRVKVLWTRQAERLLRFWRGYLAEADQATEVSAQMRVLDAAASEAWDDQMAEMQKVVTRTLREAKEAHIRYREGKADPKEMDAAMAEMTAKVAGLTRFAEQLAEPWESMEPVSSAARGKRRRKRSKNGEG